jgi:anti-sigma B factor antagonist
MLLQIDTRQIPPDITVMVLGGKIAMGRESQRIEMAVQEMLRLNQKKLILDITGVEHVDSTGIGILAYCFGTLTRAGGALRVVGAGGKVLHLLQITRLTSVLPLAASIEEACQSMSGQPAG